MDPAVYVAIISFFGVVVTAIAGIIGLIITNRGEKSKVADHSIDATLEQRLLLRDDLIENLEARLALEISKKEQFQTALREFREDADEEEREGKTL